MQQDVDALKTGISLNRSRAIDRVVAGGLCGLLGLMLLAAPLAYGSVQLWSQGLLYLLASGMAVFLVLYLVLHSRGRVVWSWAYLPILLFLALVLVQASRWPLAWLSWFSPGTIDTTTELTEGLSSESTPMRLALSLYPAETVHHLYLLLIVVVVFLTVLQLARSSRAVRGLLWMLAASGIVVGLIATAQNLSGQTGVYWGVDPSPFNSGPFTAHSHFGQFMNLAIGAVLGLWAICFHTKRDMFDTRDTNTGSSGTPSSRIVHGLFAAGVVLMALLIALAATRGGLVAGAVAITFVASCFVLRRWGLRRSAPVVIAAAVLLVIFCGAVTLSKQATRTLPGTQAEARPWRLAEGGRLEIVRDSLPAIQSSPWVGTGLGTFEYVFPMYDRSDRPTRAAHADNDYLQLFFETGLVGAALVLLFVGIVFRGSLKALWSSSDNPDLPALYGLLYGLVAVTVHSSVDFGQRIPGVAVMTAVTLGLIVGISRRALRPGVDEHPVAPGVATHGAEPSAWRVPVGALCLLAVSVTAYSGLNYFEDHRRAELAWHVAQRKLAAFEAGRAEGADAGRRRVIKSMAQAVDLAPRDVRYRTGYHHQRWLACREAVSAAGDGAQQDTTLRKEIDLLVAESERAIRLCPTYGPAHSLTGELRRVGLNENEGIGFIVRGAELAGHDAYPCLSAGRVLAEAGRWDEAEAWFARAIRRQPRLSCRVVDLLVHDLDNPRRALSLVQDDPVALIRLIRTAHHDPRYKADALKWLETHQGFIIDASEVWNASPSTLAARAQMHRMFGETQAAAVWYEKALSFNHARPAWHYDLALILYELEDYDRAQAHTEHSLALSPGLERAQWLLASLNQP